MGASIPAYNEQTRLAALRSLLIVDTPPEQRFDNLTQYAAVLFDVRMTAIRLAEDQRVCFKASQGMTETEIARHLSFCDQVTVGKKIAQIYDTRLDARYSEHPLVQHGTGIRFYAAAALDIRHRRVGVLCLIDNKPRQLNEIECKVLHDLGRLVVMELENLDAAGRGAILAKMRQPGAHY